MTSLRDEVARRRTFAIISHPDAGKTTLTEKLLLFGGAIQMAGTVKGRKATRHATSDWMRLEQQRGISVTSSVMQFPYRGRMVNLLDTPGHEDFSEDTYRTLTAVDSALMVIDCAKGVEERTIKLMEVCRLRDTPIITFINKLDREGREPLELLDEIEKVLKITCAPITWPIGMGRELRGVYHLLEDRIYVYQAGEKGRAGHALDDRRARERRGHRLSRRPRAGISRRGRDGARRLAAVRARGVPGRPADAGVLRLRDQQFRRDGTAVGLRRVRAGAAAARHDHPQRGRIRGAAHGLRLQDPGEHGSGPPRSHRLHAHLLGALRAGHAALPHAARQGDPARRCAHVPRRGPPACGAGVRRRHHRPAQPRHHQHRRHVLRGRAAHVHGHPELRARDVPARGAAGTRCA